MMLLSILFYVLEVVLAHSGTAYNLENEVMDHIDHIEQWLDVCGHAHGINKNKIKSDSSTCVGIWIAIGTHIYQNCSPSFQ